MNLKMVGESFIGVKITIVTRSGNKIQGEVLKTDEKDDMLKIKTEDGIIIVNTNAIESIY